VCSSDLPFGQTLGNPAGNALGGTANQQSQFGAVSADTTEPGGLGSGDLPDADAAANQALLASDPPKIMGGNIIGVGSKINQRSLMVYEKAKNYRQFEFIWDPSKDVMTFGSTPPAGSTPLGQQPQPGTLGQQAAPPPASPANPNPMPPETTPDQPQEP